MSYIYELDAAHLKCSYVLPPGFVIESINASLRNWKPYDRSNMEMKYSTVVYKLDEKSGHAIDVEEIFTADSVQDLPKLVAKWAQGYKQRAVEKSPEDGTDSLIPIV